MTLVDFLASGFTIWDNLDSPEDTMLYVVTRTTPGTFMLEQIPARRVQQGYRCTEGLSARNILENLEFLGDAQGWVR